MSVIISPEGFQGSQRQQPQAHDLTFHRIAEHTSANTGGEPIAGGESCPKCKLPINNKQNRLVQDACGHTKCRMCLLNEESGCFECRQNEEQKRFSELRPPVIENYFEQNFVDQRIISPEPTDVHHSRGPDTWSRSSVVEMRNEIPIGQQQQPLDLKSGESPVPPLIRDKSPEVMFERLPSEKTASLPFKKSLRFPKIDLNGQKQVLERRFASAPPEAKEEQSKQPGPEVDSSQQTQASALRIGNVKEAAVQVSPEVIEKSTEPTDKKKRGKKAEPLPGHIKVQEGVKKSYSCDVCKRSFSSRANVHYHISCGSTEKPFECMQCGKGFISITHYKIHIRSHSGKRPFVCVYCRKDFAQKGKLRRHMMLHTGERPYCCELCGKGFRDHNALTKHSSVHTDERAFSCTKCEKKFKEISNLKKHMVVHTKDRPYMCDICGKSFGFVNTLAHHKLIHTRRRDHVCRLCDKAFRLKRDLGRHMAVHSEKKQFKCPVCEISVRRKDNLERHIRNTHPNSGGAAENLEAAARAKSNTVAVINAAPAKAAPNVRNVDSEKSPHLFVVGSQQP
ncbi:zinc finger protein 684-like [Neocloeon triangulifer]|uniref:zinc finger protein 684-like n=1 Tax=Neocloeon triangulifer TaxID=2078957 RepID=UPI00286F389E|nr:zinc finger protein 684-like [Neocloeon triangulifer]